MKKKSTAAILAFFLGGIGVHKFYLGQVFKGIIYLCFSWTGIPTILSLIDFIIILAMAEENFNSKYNSGFDFGLSDNQIGTSHRKILVSGNSEEVDRDINFFDSSITDFFEELNVNIKNPKPSLFARVAAYTVCLLLLIPSAIFVVENFDTDSKIVETVFAGTALVILSGVYMLITKRKHVKAIRMNFLMPPELEKAYDNLKEAFGKLAESKSINLIEDQEKRDNSYKKYNAGAATTFSTRWIRLISGNPIGIKSNIPISIMDIQLKTQILFFPDKIVFFNKSYRDAFDYDQVAFEIGSTRTVEQGEIPDDAKIVDHSWQYENKSGGPDKRFKDNRKIPVVSYESLAIVTPQGPSFLIYFSQKDNSKKFVRSINALASTNKNLKQLGPKTIVPSKEQNLGDRRPNLDNIDNTDFQSPVAKIPVKPEQTRPSIYPGIKNGPELSVLKEKISHLVIQLNKKLISESEFKKKKELLIKGFLNEQKLKNKNNGSIKVQKAKQAKTISIDSMMTVSQLKNRFKEIFGTGIRIYSGNRFADPDSDLSTIGYLFNKKINIKLPIHVEIGKLEKAFTRNCGIKIQIESKGGKLANNALSLSQIAE